MSFLRAQIVIRIFKPLQQMFVAQALYNFSKAALAPPQPKEENEPLYTKQKEDPQEKEGQSLKRARQEDHEDQLARDGDDKFHDKQAQNNKQKEPKQSTQKKSAEEDQIAYLTFQKGDKILVEQAYENGWWFGHVIKRPGAKEENGFFPSNYVKAGGKPPPPAPPKHKPQQQEEEYEQEYQEGPQQPQEEDVGAKLQQLGAVQGGPVGSDYYQGITRYKYVKINDNNKNILNASYVKFDAATGLAKVPVKDQAPAAKAVRQMGYYFDYHQWNQEKNKNPEAYRNRPDPRKKRQKKLRLVGMGKDA